MHRNDALYCCQVTLGEVAGVISTLLGVSFIWPQVVRVYRRHSVEGLSVSANLASVSGAILWTVFGAATGRAIAVVANVAVGVGLVLITVMFVRHRAITAPGAMAVVVITSVVSGALVPFSAHAVGVLGLIVSTPAILPQLWRTFTSPGLYGVSVSANLLLCATAVGWFIYGIEVAEPLYVYPNALLVPCTLVIAVRARQSRHRTAVVDHASR